MSERKKPAEFPEGNNHEKNFGNNANSVGGDSKRSGQTWSKWRQTDDLR
jgi:hypothetical protein